MKRWINLIVIILLSIPTTARHSGREPTTRKIPSHIMEWVGWGANFLQWLRKTTTTKISTWCRTSVLRNYYLLHILQTRKQQHPQGAQYYQLSIQLLLYILFINGSNRSIKKAVVIWCVKWYIPKDNTIALV